MIEKEVGMINLAVIHTINCLWGRGRDKEVTREPPTASCPAWMSLIQVALTGMKRKRDWRHFKELSEFSATQLWGIEQRKTPGWLKDFKPGWLKNSNVRNRHRFKSRQELLGNEVTNVLPDFKSERLTWQRAFLRNKILSKIKKSYFDLLKVNSCLATPAQTWCPLPNYDDFFKNKVS